MNMAKKKRYYAVFDDYGPLELAPDLECGSLLLRGDACTLFETYERARAAKRRSDRYAARHGFQWGVSRIVRCENETR